MNLAQMRTILLAAEDRIDNYAAGNPAFDKQREAGRETVEIREHDVAGVPMRWSAFEFGFQGELHTYVLDAAGAVIGHNVEKRGR